MQRKQNNVSVYVSCRQFFVWRKLVIVLPDVPCLRGDEGADARTEGEEKLAYLIISKVRSSWTEEGHKNWLLKVIYCPLLISASDAPFQSVLPFINQNLDLSFSSLLLSPLVALWPLLHLICWPFDLLKQLNSSHSPTGWALLLVWRIQPQPLILSHPYFLVLSPPPPLFKSSSYRI